MLDLNTIPTYDAIIVGGGPAGSTCASILAKSDVNTLLLDRGNFPRVKLVRRWLSPPIWNILDVAKEYTRGSMGVEQCSYPFSWEEIYREIGWIFHRRYEFDDFLLKRSKVPAIKEYDVSTDRKR